MGEVDGMVSGAAHTTGRHDPPGVRVHQDRVPACRSSRASSSCAWPTACWSTATAPSIPTRRRAARRHRDQLGGHRGRASASNRGSRCSPTRPATSGSGRSMSTRSREATETRARAPAATSSVDGPIQYDAAVDESVGQAEAARQRGRRARATVFIFPDLDTGNIAYKAVQRSAGAVAIGPVLQGLRKPVNDLVARLLGRPTSSTRSRSPRSRRRKAAERAVRSGPVG